MPILAVLSMHSSSSHVTHPSYAMVPLPPSFSQHSSATCGAKGESMSTSFPTPSFGGSLSLLRWLVKTMRAEMAVLNAMASTSSETFFIV